MLRLYKSLVRPHLEYCIQAWRPYLQKDVDKLERVQRRFTKIIPELRNMPYEQRLNKLKLTTLETRRIRGDMLEVFKIVKGLEGLNASDFFEFSTSTTRGHTLKLFKQRSRLDVRKYSFSQRVINEWNSLPEDAINVDTINSFKGKLDKFLRHREGAYKSQRVAGSLLRRPPQP